MDKYVADSSVVLDGTLKEAVVAGKVRGTVFILSELVEYFSQLARSGDGVGVVGMEELSDLYDVVDKLGLGDFVKIEVVPAGRRLEPGELDAYARRLAKENGYVYITSDELARDTAVVEGVEVLYLGRTRDVLAIEKFFGPDIMSVHLKEDLPPFGKAGRPGSWRIVQLSEEPLTRKQLEAVVRELISEASRLGPRTKIEIRRPHSMIIQHKEYRIVIVFPPVSERLEITATRPVVRKRIEDYGLDPRVLERLEKSAEGILIAGAPGAGKTTFAQALAEFYLSKGRVVKTVESPRDMVLSPAITQLSKNLATSEEIHDLLLLSRPDYTIFDEMRDTADFQLYVDLRLAGVGMVGVVHATSPIDAIQRFIRRVELGMIPSIIDTVIFMRDGEVRKIYALSMVVKVPAGMREEDLARPVILVKDFLTDEVEYEIYVFGEETFVVPVKRVEEGRAPSRKIYSMVVSALKRYVPPSEIRLEERDGLILIKVPEEYLGVVLSRGVTKLEKLRRKLSVDFRIEAR
ncbi:PINc/VapC family ATPase [Pyrobaculum sp. 3827-6]|uniref:PINc/VapC family ATPase n=1 Tax=Pyrobaculum sp. 3827-6 TaxID=2983604 RepID=UPI0021DB7116|nr:PINc/VapC family ATPase [Pyrobaculum sp. 3827-6]MCU7787401.1 PINc/VapC family ATPase [Pyrobaculum sp. 3827-6]